MVGGLCDRDLPWTETPQMETPLDRDPPDRDPPDRDPPDRDPPWTETETPPPVNRMTDRQV